MNRKLFIITQVVLLALLASSVGASARTVPDVAVPNASITMSSGAVSKSVQRSHSYHNLAAGPNVPNADEGPSFTYQGRLIDQTARSLEQFRSASSCLIVTLVATR
jgi:hypothetical protein